jgi:hypothetical protein
VASELMSEPIRRIDLWGRWFPGIPPIAHQLKYVLRDRWIRIHSLPNSQRYPKDEKEMQTVLTRFRRVFEEVAVPSPGCILVTMDWTIGLPPDEIHFKPFTKGRKWRVVEQEECSPWTLFAHECSASSYDFEPLVRMTADDEIANLMIIDWDGDWILHPYDGGTDVIARDSMERDRLGRLFSEWKSPNSTGL